MPVWIPLLITLIGGGAMGAFLNNYIQDRRSRKQPISLGIELTPIFLPVEILETHHLVVTLADTADEKSSYHYNTLYLVTLYFKNIGNKDIVKFDFRLSLSEEGNFIHFVKSSDGSMHEVSSIPAVDLANSSPFIDFKFDPFNRRDEYVIKAYFSSSNKNIKTDDIKVDTKQPVIFSRSNKFSAVDNDPEVSKAVRRIEKYISVTLGFITITVSLLIEKFHPVIDKLIDFMNNLFK